MRELHVIDPHGNLLKFGESVLPADGAVPPIADTIRPDGTERPARRNETRSAGDLQIRPYRDADEAQVVDLWERCALLRPWNDPRKDIARKQRVQPDLFLVGTIGETVVAVVMTGYDGHRGWVNYLAVDPTLRRQGFAAALMSEAERRLRDLGCAKVNLQIRRDNTEAIAFYERIGFAEDAVRSLGKRLESDWPR